MCFVFSLTGDVLTGDSEGNILTWGKSAADIKTLGKGAKGVQYDSSQYRRNVRTLLLLHCNFLNR